MLFTIKEFIQEWKNKDYSTYNEQDVREEFIRPLLYLLGYSKNSINNILTEKQLSLSEPFQRLGRQKIRIDYIPTIRLKAFWILEAKPGEPKKMDVGDMLQAYLYATHPEIQAPYIVLCNGWEIKIYDVHNYSNWKQPIFTINECDCEVKFQELKEILGAEDILKFQRSNLLDRICDTFEVEIEESQLEEFSIEFNKLERKLKPIIKENARQLWQKEFEKSCELERAKVKSIDDDMLITLMNSYSDVPYVEEEYYTRIEDSNFGVRKNLLDKLSKTYNSRAIAPFRCRYLNILIKIIKNESKLHLESDLKLKIDNDIIETVENNLNYFKGNEYQMALCHLDRMCCKAAGVIVKNGAMELAIERANNKMAFSPKEERILRNITPAHEIVPFIFCMADSLFAVYCTFSDSDEINKQTALLKDLIDKIMDKEGIKQYPNQEHDLFCFEEFGDEYDYLCGVTCNIVRHNIDVMKQIGLDECIIGRVLSRDFKSIIPKYKKDVVGSITDENIICFQDKLLKAFILGTKKYYQAQRIVSL